jgi:hypothetical protein
MKKCLRNSLKASSVLLVMLFSCLVLKAQTIGEKKEIPPFNILLTNSTYFKASGVTKNVPLVLIYFDPTCEHCKAFTTSLIQHIKDLRKTQIIMISYTPFSQVKQFETDFHLNRYSNIKVGTEGYTFVVQRYYHIDKFPFVALFNAKGSLIASYYNSPQVDEIISTLNANR